MAALDKMLPFVQQEQQLLLLGGVTQCQVLLHAQDVFPQLLDMAEIFDKGE